MPCFKPVKGWWSDAINPSGKRNIVYRPALANVLHNGQLDSMVRPCGQCKYCRAERTRQWGLRCALESKTYQQNCFITLTYAEEFLPKHGWLDWQAPVLFMKRLRKKYGAGIRSYGCAEYGTKGLRPHYHICLFGHDFTDKKEIRSKGRDPLFESKELKELWPFGFSSVGTLTFESAAYVASYCQKKLNGKLGKIIAKANEITDEQTGEVYTKPMERSVCLSRGKGIGKQWYEKNGLYVRNHDAIILNGIKMRPPAYFDKLTEKHFPEDYIRIKEQRKEKGEQQTKKMEEEDVKNFRKMIYGPEAYRKKTPLTRLRVMEMVEELKAKHFKRNYEDG